jgi:hypothetical protein
LLLRETLEAVGLDPVAELASLLSIESALDPKSRAEVCLRLMDYLYPKRRPQELETFADPGGNDPRVVILNWADEDSKLSSAP